MDNYDSLIRVFDELKKGIEELKIKVPNLLDLIDEVIQHETRFKSIDIKSDTILKGLKSLEESIRSVDMTKEKLKALIEDDNNIASLLLLISKLCNRNETKDSLCKLINSDELQKALSGAILSKKEEISEFVWKDLEIKLQLYIGKKVLAGTISVGVILGVIVMAFNFLQRYF